MLTLNRLYVSAGAVLVILVLSSTSCNLYKGKVAAEVKADIATDAVSEAVVESKAAVKADAQVQRKKRTVLDTVAPALSLTKENYPESPCSPSTPDPWIGLFNDAVRSSNAAIESSGSMP